MKNAIDKDISYMNDNGIHLENGIMNFLKWMNLTSILKECCIKSKLSYPAHLLFITFFILPFINKNVYREIVINNNRIVSKDAMYRFLKSTKSNWRKFLIKIAIILITFFNKLTKKERTKILIIDDTTFKKNSSKYVEYLSKCYDHTDNTYYKGFRLLNCLWSDGYSQVPLEFSLLASQNAENRLQGTTKTVDPRSNAAKRRKEAVCGAPDAVLALVKYALDFELKNIAAVTFDTWFATSRLIVEISKNIPVVCMLKKCENILFRFKNRLLSIKSIYRVIKKKPGGAKIIGSAIIDVIFKKENIVESTKAKVIFITHKKTGDWIPILCTNTALSDKKIIEIYGLRWDIEVFHRDVKQYLYLEVGSQSTDFDALIANITIVYIRYMFLAYRKRKDEDHRTIGLLFHACCEEVKQISVEEALLNILKEVYSELKSKTTQILDKHGQQLYNLQQIADSFSSVYEHGIEFTMKDLIRRQKDLENLGASMAARFQAAVA